MLEGGLSAVLISIDFTMNAIETHELTKTFNGLTAVDGVNMTVRMGEVFGFLGPNGAGKTTTINMLATLTNPTSGSALVAGIDVAKNPASVRERIALVFQESVLDNYLTGRENMLLHGDLWGVPKAESKERTRSLLDLVELSGRADDLVMKYSGGMRRRLEIARGLIANPEILFLDEPTLGLDPATRRHVWEYVEKMREERRLTVFLTTHYMDEAQQLCDRVAIMDHGKIIVTDKPERLIDTLGGDVVEVSGSGDAENALLLLKNREFVKRVSKAGKSRISLTVEDGQSAIPKVMRILQTSDFDVNSVSLKEPTLEDVFIHFTGRSMREEESAESPWKRAKTLKQLTR